MNEITKKKISAKLKGRPKAARTKWLIKESLKGRTLSNEHKVHISNSMKEYHKRRKKLIAITI